MEKRRTRKDDNLRQAQILWEDQNGRYTDDLDSLVAFIQEDSTVQARIAGTDTLTGKSTNPFVPLTSGQFSPESLYFAPRSHERFIMQVDTTVVADTVVNRYGNLDRVDTTITIGENYIIESPDSDDKIGDLYNEALRNTASWE